MQPRRLQPLALEHRVLYESADPERVFAYSPGLVRLPSGRLLATMDQGGPGVADLAGPKGWRGEGRHAWQGRIYTSDDHGVTWQERGLFPFMHARPFVGGNRVYILGHDADLCVIASDDEGDTWTDVKRLTDGQAWHQSACNVHHARGRVHLVMERRVYDEVQGWPVSELAPVLMVADATADLTLAASWTFASELVFKDLDKATMVGVPFWSDRDRSAQVTQTTMFPAGWLETNVVEFTDPDHLWHDPAGRTVHLWMRAHTGATGLACIAKVVEESDHRWTTQLVHAPSGRPMLYAPCPGGQMRFHILQDENTYWLLSSQATDSMRRPDRLPSNRYGLPNNERHVLTLHFSKNCIDWCMAGIVAVGQDAGQARHYASMVVDGEDLHVLSRSGDERAHSAHDGNLITLHTISSFRELIY